MSQCALHEKLHYIASCSIIYCIFASIPFALKNDTGFVYYHTEPIVTTGWAYCFLQPTPVSNTDPLSESATNYTLRVSISNDNVTYSDELTFVIYDGTCVNCSNKPPYMCAQKVNYRPTIAYSYKDIDPQRR